MGTYRPTVRGYAADAPVASRKSGGLGSPTESSTTGTGGVCYRCYWPGHYVAEYPISLAHMNVAVPFTAQQYPHPMHYSGGWEHESSPGSNEYTSTVAPPPQLFSNNCDEQKNDGSCAPTFNPNLLTAQFTHKDKDRRSGSNRGNGREKWVADSGATFHITGNAVGMVDCIPPLQVGEFWY